MKAGEPPPSPGYVTIWQFLNITLLTIVAYALIGFWGYSKYTLWELEKNNPISRENREKLRKAMGYPSDLRPR